MREPNVSELAALITRFAPSDGSHSTAVPGLKLFRAAQPSEPTPVVYEPSLCVIAQGSKVVLLGTERYRYDPAHFLLVSVDLPVTGCVTLATQSEPYLGLSVGLCSGTVGELLAEGACGDAPTPAARGMAVSAAEPQLLGAVARLVGLLGSPRDVTALAPLVLREITYRVLTGPQGARLRQIAATGAPAQRIVRAIRWLRDHYTEPLSVSALAKLASMSASAFHQHFRAVTSLSPIQYQKRLRLQEARRLMLTDGLDAASAAYRVGYESPSQFSREYRRQFGAPPRRDVAALVVPAAPADGSRATR